MKLAINARAQEIRKQYEAALRFLTIANSSYGKLIRETKPSLVVFAKGLVTKLQADYVQLLIDTTDSIVGQMKTEIYQAQQALKIISEDSHDAIKELNELIDQTTKQLQDIVLYNPNEFYENYFFSLVSPITDEINESVTKNERFRLWFTGSKCVDKDNKPQIFFHGTGGLKVDEFDEFSFSPFPGAYFAENKSYADWFANYRSGKSILYRVYLRVTNPIDLTGFKVDKVTYQDFVNFIKFTYGYTLPENKMLRAMSNAQNGMWAWQYLRSGVDWLKLIKNQREFDGFVYYENNPQDRLANGEENVTRAYLVLNGNQIKSADSRNTTFSLESNSIKMKEGGTVC
jgi:hypothetical protein